MTYVNGKLNETELKGLVEKLITESAQIVPVAPTQNSVPVEEPKK